jgi:transposase
VKRCAQPPAAARVIGIDEWATRKGRTYGTIVVDLERHTVVDVLEQHSTEVVEQWLAGHPDVQMICRDRNGRYAKAARTAAPAARQTTDRFHLVQNLRETIERELALHRAYLRVRVTPDGLPAAPQSTLSLTRRSVRPSRVNASCCPRGAWPSTARSFDNSERPTSTSSTRSKSCRRRVGRSR